MAAVLRIGGNRKHTLSHSHSLYTLSLFRALSLCLSFSQVEVFAVAGLAGMVTYLTLEYRIDRAAENKAAQ